MRLIFSILTRKDKQPRSLSSLLRWLRSSHPYDHYDTGPWFIVGHDAPSFYEGHTKNLNQITIDYGEIEDEDVIVFVHDDVEIISNYDSVYESLKLCNNSTTGFVGVAGSLKYDKNTIGGAWWNARHTNDTRGFVFQGENNAIMQPNWFGSYGEVAVLDGLFLAIEFKKLKKLNLLTKPEFLTSGWDFYDIHMTLKSYLEGLTNYAVPIICRHESSGEMRKEWYTSNEELLRHYSNVLPIKLPRDATNGLPV